MAHPIVELARKAIEVYVKEHKLLAAPDNLAPEMKQKAGVFVSLHKHGDLRGCIGTFMPMAENLAEEIIHNAIESATKDPRFLPVINSELSDLDISVDVLTEPVPVKSIEELDPKKYGVIVKDAYNRRGLLLPDIPGVESVQQQIEICRKKAWIEPDDPIELFRFEVKRYH